MKVSGQFYDPAALPQGNIPWYPLDRRQGGPQSCSGRGGLKILGSSLSIVTRLRAGGWTTGVQFSAGALMGIFLFTTASRPPLGNIQPPIQ